MNKKWEKIEVFMQFVRVFYDITLKVSVSTHPTIHTTFHDVLSIKQEIHKLFVEPEMITESKIEKNIDKYDNKHEIQIP